MIGLVDLWLPILVATVVMWFVSWIVWALMPWHRSDYAALPDEEAARKALGGTPPGAYNVPNLPDRKALGQPEYKAKFEEGPVGFVYVAPSRVPAMGPQLGLWFVFNLLVAACAAYVVSMTVPAGADYLLVFRIVATTVWMAHGFAYVTESIWFFRPWRLTVKNLVDALVYSLFAAGVFGWLWPGA